jgi:hypothetical protein
MPTVDFRDSRLEAILLVLTQAAALLALLVGGAPPLLRLLLGTLVAGQLVSSVIRGRRRCFEDSATLRLGLGTAYCLLWEGARRSEWQPPAVRYLSEWLIILELRPRHGHRGQWRSGRCLLVWPDSLGEQDLWRLRRYLAGLAGLRHGPLSASRPGTA